MGTWGPGLYSDDTACDVRDRYKDLLSDGISEPEATQRLVKEWQHEISDPDTAPVFWLALADTQWNLGRLQDMVRAEALAVIHQGTDLARWQTDVSFSKKRSAVLVRLRQKLNSAQPAEKKIKPRYISTTEWQLGDVYSLRLQSGTWILLHVIGFHQNKNGRMPVCALFDWTGENVPNQKAIHKMNYKQARWPDQRPSQFRLASLREKDFPGERVRLVAKRIKPKQDKGNHAVILWRYIDRMLEEFFGLHG